MATGGFKSSAATDFLEEWKAKREKMRAKMLGDIAAATGTPLAAKNTNNTMNNNSNGNPDKSSPTGNCQETSHPAAPIASTPPAPTSTPTSAPTTAPTASQQGGNLKKGPMQTEVQSVSPGTSSMACPEIDGRDSPSPSHKGSREKKSSGPSARKGKGQIEKRKLREKRRSTGVVSIPSNESLDELDDDDVGGKGRREEKELVQANTFQNEMTADPTMGHLMDTPRAGTGRHKSSAGPGVEDETNGNNRRQSRHPRDGASAVAGLEKRLDELERELIRQRQENAQLLKAHEEKDDLIVKLKEEIDLLNRDLDDIEDENDQLKQENKTLLKVVGQLTR
ncbi:PRKC apoptosis WT1 regulator protein [Periophthalmus magnuspinnatus]|uniref:PRKC apoptosis WT1 regulator protein n=1 Tax=Periophthalmus magnuspinnatus TaxID=409849 RepID=UPI00145B5522|nr:PRKC apoptosis WT1 regulator protein [Periophthalmus magnuspinnatus]